MFTGQSGIDAEKCLGRLNQELNPKAQIISVEKRMSEISDKSFPKEILLESISSQYELWQKAFGKILQDIGKSKSTNKLLFLTLHGVYYHQDKREFVSPIDPEMIRKLRGKVKALLVFIDDIYDIYRRLMKDGEMFSQVKKAEKLQALYSSTVNLITILEWREIEIAISRLIQRVLEVPMYIIATKHPASMIAKLISTPVEQLEVYYLSHPISSIRDEAKQRIPAFLGELNVFSQNIINRPETVIFLPSTIDELIIEKEDNVYVPQCSPRWSLPYEEEAYISPSLPADLKQINPLNPSNYDVSKAPTDIQKSISYLMNLLWDYIDMQTTSRDLSLVEQSKNGVIAYRPYFPYRLSGGALREIEHNHELSKRETSRRCIIFSTLEDQGKARIKHFFASVMTTVEGLEEATRMQLESKCADCIQKNEWIKMFYNTEPLEQNIEKIRAEVDKILPRGYRFQKEFLYPTSLPRGQMGTEEKERRRGYQSIINSTLRDPLREYQTSAEDYQFFDPHDIMSVGMLLRNCLSR